MISIGFPKNGYCSGRVSTEGGRDSLAASPMLS